MKIVYKIVNSAVVLAMIPVLLFLPMFRFIMNIGISSSNQILSIFGNMIDLPTIIKNATGVDFNSLPEYFTIRGVYDLLFAENGTFAATGLDTAALPEELIRYFSAAAILFAIALVFALLVLIIGLFVKKKLVTASFAVCGAASLLAANKCFTIIADKLISGKVSLMALIENMEALSKYSKYLEYIDIDIRILELSSAYTMLMLVFGALIALNIVFHLVDTTTTK